MFSRNITPWHQTILMAREEARETGSRKVEAEHILLALSRQQGTDAQQVLESAGLDHDAILEAMEKEFEQSLEAVGVSLPDAGFTHATGPAKKYDPKFGQSGKLALKRAYDLEEKRLAPPLEPIHLLVGVLQAEAGTVPRILAASDADTTALTREAEEVLSKARESA